MPIYEVKLDREVEAFVGSLFRRFAVSLAVLIGIGCLSTLGLLLSGTREGPLWERGLLAFWDTLNLVSTVGSLEEPFTVGQRVWASLVIIFGLGAVLYAFGSLQSLLHGGDVRRHFVRQKMKSELAAMNDHQIVCGFGQVGRAVATKMRNAGQPLVVIDWDERAVADADDDGFLVLHGDCTDERTLEDAGVDRARGLIASLDTDAPNVYLTLIARHRNSALRIVARADRPASRPTLRRAGADRVIVPGELAAVHLSQFMLTPRMSDFLEAAVGEGEYEFGEIVVGEEGRLAGRTLAELDLPRNHESIVISLLPKDGDEQFNPSLDRPLEAGDTLLMVCRGGTPSDISSG